VLSKVIPLPSMPEPGVRLSVSASKITEMLADALSQCLRCVPPSRRQQVVFLCIGTGRSVGDALGPMVGSLLLDAGWGAGRVPGGAFKRCGVSRVSVHGTLERPAHAEGVPLPGGSRQTTVVVIGACLGSLEDIGSIDIRLGPIQPCIGLTTRVDSFGDLLPVGDVSMAGTIGEESMDPFLEATATQAGLQVVLKLKEPDARLVMYMAAAISSGVLMALGAYPRNPHKRRK